MAILLAMPEKGINYMTYVKSKIIFLTDEANDPKNLSSSICSNLHNLLPSSDVCTDDINNAIAGANVLNDGIWSIDVKEFRVEYIGIDISDNTAQYLISYAMSICDNADKNKTFMTDDYKNKFNELQNTALKDKRDREFLEGGK